MRLVVNAIGLTEDRLCVAAESRLRTARIYTDSGSKANEAILEVQVAVFGSAFGVFVSYKKIVIDETSGVRLIATTWNTSSVGTYDDPGYIVQNVSENVDKFLVEYLRVNEKDCLR